MSDWLRLVLRVLGLCATVCCWMAVSSRVLAQSGDFYLKSGDTVVFYGDSITEQNLYNQWVELYTVTRFPSMRVRFFGAGVRGDTVSGGIGGEVDERLERDVFARKPTVVTVLLGMNDGGFGPASDDVLRTYAGGYDHLLKSIHKRLPGVRVTAIGTSPYDDVTRPPEFAGGYNGVMGRYIDMDRELAHKYGDIFVDLNAPVVALLERAKALDPLVAKLILPDRVHPGPIAHWVMAEALLKGWNAPALVSAVTIDAKAARASEAENAEVSQVEAGKDELSWTETEKALPLAFSRGDAYQALQLDLTDIEQQLNQETLRVSGLAAGQYKLTIDGKAVETFSAEELARGINLAEYGTPMIHQSLIVGRLVHDRAEARSVHMEMLVRKFEGPKGRLELMDSYEKSLEDAMYEAGVPKPHVYRLRRAEAVK